MTAIRDRHLAASGASIDDLHHDYRFLRLGDLLSLTFCNAWPEPQADAFGYRIRFDGTRLTVSPDPFGGDEIPLEITARTLPKRPYESADDAAREWEAATIVDAARRRRRLVGSQVRRFGAFTPAGARPFGLAGASIENGRPPHGGLPAGRGAAEPANLRTV